MATRDEIVEALKEKIRQARAAGAGKADSGGPQIKEKVIIHKFDHTPLPGEIVEPLETVIFEDGQMTVLPGKGE
jgi:hypothetical protein